MPAFPRVVILIALFASGASARVSAVVPGRPGSEIEAWEAASRLLIRDALEYFELAAKKPGDRAREIALARAVLLLNEQPKTESNLRQASQLLDGVIAANRTDEPGVSARYLKARIAHLHAFRPDRAEAIRMYESLYQDVPRHPMGQGALARAYLLRLYEPGDAGSKRPLMEEIEEAATRLDDPDARREIAGLLADGWGYLLDDWARVLPHLYTIERLGLRRRGVRLDHYVRTAEIARQAGQRDVAAAYYRRFLAEAERDTRVTLVRERLAETEAVP